MRKGRRNSLRERDKKKTNLFNKNRKRKVYPEKKRRTKNCSMRSEKKEASLRINREERICLTRTKRIESLQEEREFYWKE